MPSDSTTSRLDAFDNLRALMMWLGIVLHVCVNHFTMSTPLPWRDSQTSVAADLLFVFIHAFRMPVFFILSGYLALMLVATRGEGAMVRHRLRRIALPFAVFWPLLKVGIACLVLVYLHLMARGTIGFDLTLRPPADPGRPALFGTMHMWFIYYLLIFSLLAGAAVRCCQYLPVRLSAAWHAAWRAMLGNWWGVLPLTVPLTLVGMKYPGGMVSTDGSFIPNGPELLHNGMFFLFGWSLFRERAHLLDRYARHCWRNLAAGLVSFVVVLKLFGLATHGNGQVPNLNIYLAFTYGMTSWLWSIGLVGLFLRYLARQNRLLRYVSDSSYWVFLVHMLGTIGFGVLLYDAALDALPKMAINIVATSAACLLSYHWFVRATWVGVLLNGTRRGATARAVATVPAQ